MSSTFESIGFVALLFLIVPVPIGTSRRLSRVPWITISLIVINLLVFLAEQHVGRVSSGDLDVLFNQFGLIPRELRLWSFFTALFFHMNVSHLLWNMGFLWLFGPPLEEDYGWLAYTILYFAGGLAAGVLHVAITLFFAGSLSPAYVPLIGASGAIAALLGAFLVRFPNVKLRLYWVPVAMLTARGGIRQVPAVYGLGIWILQTIVGALAALVQPDHGSIAYWAHIGGFLLGVGAAELIALIDMRRNRNEDGRRASPLVIREAAAKSQSPSRNRGRATPGDYAELVSWNIRRRRASQAAAIYKEALAAGHDPALVSADFLVLAAYFVANEEAGRGALLYERLAEEPESPLGRRACLELASLYLGRLDNIGAAKQTLRTFLAAEGLDTTKADVTTALSRRNQRR